MQRPQGAKENVACMYENRRKGNLADVGKGELLKMLVRVFGFCPQNNGIREGHA